MRLLLLSMTLLGLMTLSACPSDSGGKDTDGTGDGETLSCEPGALVECIEEGGPRGMFCGADGSSLISASCPGQSPQCRNNTCYEYLDNQICYPGESQGCIVERGKEAFLCNETRTGFTRSICKGPDGLDSQCINGECTTCFPFTRKCLDERTVAECKADGSGWVEFLRCEGDSEVCTGSQCEELCERNRKFNSYIGCDYFAVDLDNAMVPGGGNGGYYDAAGAQFAVVVANPGEANITARVSIFRKQNGVEERVMYDSDGALIDETLVPPGELKVFKLPRRDVEGTTLDSLAYKVSANVPIVAYQFNPLANEGVYSNDASLLLPANLLGSEYFVMTREQTFETLRGYLTIVGVMTGETQVAVTVRAPTQAGIAHPNEPERRTSIASMQAGETRIFKLNQYDVLSLQTNTPGADLTGSYVVSSQRVAVFGGSEAANAPNTARCVDINENTGVGVCEWDKRTTCRSLLDCVNAGFNTCCADHLEQQMFPLRTWGSRYFATKSWDRGLELDIYRIMAATDNTTVELYPPQPGITIPVLNRGEHFEFESAANFEIVARDDKPIMVGHFLAAQDAPDPNVGGRGTEGDAGTGDPAFMLLVPVEQFRPDYVILTPVEYAMNFINIVAPIGAQVHLNGTLIPTEEFMPFGSGDFMVHRRPVDPGAHSITASSNIGLIVYGYDRYVSYAYTGGLNLNEIRNEQPLNSGN